MQIRERTVGIEDIQAELKRQQIDGWLFYSFRDSDPLAARILHLDGGHVTRRWFYFVPAKGAPGKLLHRIETHALAELPGDSLVYLSHQQLKDRLKELLGPARKVAMQYSPENAIPYVSRVDGGTIELVRSLQVEVVSSADLVQFFEARLSQDQLRTHLTAVENLRRIVFDAFGKIAEDIRAGRSTNEYEVQQFIWRRYSDMGMISDSPCIVAVNANSGRPHYQPTSETYAPIKEGDFVLLDMWAKLKDPADAVYGDITWTGYVGRSVPERHAQIFEVVSGARDAAVDYIKSQLASGGKLEGWKVDDVTREFIGKRGYGDSFIHRTGHSIGTQVHGNGANIDNLETQDKRSLLPNTCFSIEPGVYLPEFGVRSEIDVYITEKEAIIGGQPIQTAVIPILSLT
jgi:Xaa-Pro aminopeptidase